MNRPKKSPSSSSSSSSSSTNSTSPVIDEFERVAKAEISTWKGARALLQQLHQDFLSNETPPRKKLGIFFAVAWALVHDSEQKRSQLVVSSHFSALVRLMERPPGVDENPTRINLFLRAFDHWLRIHKESASRCRPAFWDGIDLARFPVPSVAKYAERFAATLTLDSKAEAVMEFMIRLHLEDNSDDLDTEFVKTLIRWQEEVRGAYPLFAEEIAWTLSKAPLGRGLVVWNPKAWRGDAGKRELYLDGFPVPEGGRQFDLKLPLKGRPRARVRHATNTSALLKMIKEAATSGFLEFKGRRKSFQYAGCELAWFGIDVERDPEVREFIESANPAQVDYEFNDVASNAAEHIRENRYGCAVLEFGMSLLLEDHPTLWALGERKYTKELSQTVLIDKSSGAQTWKLFKDGSLHDLKPIEVRPYLIKEDISSLLILLQYGETEKQKSLTWPYKLKYTADLWSHPEFAVHGSFKLNYRQRLRIRFVEHNGGTCVPSLYGTCECEKKLLRGEAGRKKFIEKVCAEGPDTINLILKFQQDCGEGYGFHPKSWSVINEALQKELNN